MERKPIRRVDSDAGRDWGQEEKGTTENEMAGWHHWLDGHESEWTPGVGDGQGRPGVLRFMGSQRVGHDWVTELNWTDCKNYCKITIFSYLRGSNSLSKDNCSFQLWLQIRLTHMEIFYKILMLWSYTPRFLFHKSEVGSVYLYFKKLY